MLATAIAGLAVACGAHRGGADTGGKQVPPPLPKHLHQPPTDND